MEDRGHSPETHSMVDILQDRDTTGLNHLEDAKIQQDVIDCDHRIFLDHQTTLLDALDVNVTDVTRT